MQVKLRDTVISGESKESEIHKRCERLRINRKRSGTESWKLNEKLDRN